MYYYQPRNERERFTNRVNSRDLDRMCGAFRGEMKYNLVKQVEKNNTQAEKKNTTQRGMKIHLHAHIIGGLA